jgi:HlyD family secretion protein
MPDLPKPKGATMVTVIHPGMAPSESSQPVTTTVRPSDAPRTADSTLTTVAAQQSGIPDRPAAPIKKPQKPAAPFKRRRSFASMFVMYLLPLGALALLSFAGYEVIESHHVDAPVAPPVQPPQAPYSNSVAGNGMIEAQTENIEVGSPVPGLVVEVFAKEGDKVRAGDPLFRLDDRQLKAELKVHEADVAAAKAQLSQLENQPRPEEVPVSEAMVTEAEADLTQQRDNLRRIQELFNRRVATDQELTQAQQNCNMAQARLTHANAQLTLLKAGAWQYQKDVAKAAIVQAESQVDQTKTELDRLIVRALVDGDILHVNVRPGEYVGAPHNDTLMLLGNVTNMHVRVDIDEHDIPRFRLDAPARAIVKGHPELSFSLKFVRVDPYVVPKKSLTGMNTERVDTRVLQVIYSFQPGKMPVYVGQQVEVFLEAQPTADTPTPTEAPASPSPAAQTSLKAA